MLKASESLENPYQKHTEKHIISGKFYKSTLEGEQHQT